MTSPLVLLQRGAGGLLPAEPLDFDNLVLPASPNTCLVGPPGWAGPQHFSHAPWPVAPAVLWATLNRVAAGMPRNFKLGEWPERLQAQWVERSALMNYPDIIAAEVRPHAAGAALLLYSRSLFGWSDLGVNKARAERWLAALDAALNT